MRIGRIAKTRRAAAKRFRTRQELRVNFQPNDRLVQGQGTHRAEIDREKISDPCGLERDPDAWDRLVRDADSPSLGFHHAP